MPQYPHICEVCEEAFDVTRAMAEAGDPAYCPLCGREARRIFGSHPIIFRPDGWNLSPTDPNYARNLPIKQERLIAQR